MSTQSFLLPDLGEGLTEAALVRWLVEVGEQVVVDQPVAEVETAKSVIELPSPFAGTISRLHGDEGETLDVGAPLLEVSTGAASPGTASDAPAHFDTYREEERAGSGNVLVGYGTKAESTPRRRRAAVAAPTSQATPAGSAPPSAPAAPQPSTLPGAASIPHTPTTRSSGSVAVISPIVRRLARESGLDLHAIVPTGRDGIVTRRDVLAALDGSRTAPPPPSQTDEVDTATGLPVRAHEPLSMFRRTVADKMSTSRREIPEATVWLDVDATALTALRERALVDDRHVSLTAFLARFVLLALADYPLLAGRLSEDARNVTEFAGVNLGIAADTPRGLMVPTIRDPSGLSIAQLDSAIRDLGTRAREGSLRPAELTGSTFTLNNYGVLGVDGSAAIINHPEVAILGVGRFLPRPWVHEGEITARTITELTLSFDHRVCDGGYASGFLRAVAGAIENPEAALLR